MRAADERTHHQCDARHYAVRSQQTPALYRVDQHRCSVGLLAWPHHPGCRVSDPTPRGASEVFSFKGRERPTRIGVGVRSRTRR